MRSGKMEAQRGGRLHPLAIPRLPIHLAHPPGRPLCGRHRDLRNEQMSANGSEGARPGTGDTAALSADTTPASCGLSRGRANACQRLDDKQHGQRTESMSQASKPHQQGCTWCGMAQAGCLEVVTLQQGPSEGTSQARKWGQTAGHCTCRCPGAGRRLRH